LCQRADDAASGRAGCCSEGRRRKPSRRDHWSKARNGEQPETGQQACCATKACADAGALSGTFGTVVDPVAVAIDFLSVALLGSFAS
jgi:hypothetical protein